MNTGAELWRPDPGRVASSELAVFQRWLAECGTGPGADAPYDALWRWSCANLATFWAAVAAFYDVVIEPSSEGLVPASMPGSGWFPGTTLNYADQVFRSGRTGDAVVAVDEDGAVRRTTWVELRRQVGALAAELRRAGVRHGDRVAAVLPVGTEAVVAQLATAAVGAIWSVVSPEFGDEAIVSRLGQLEPVLLIATSTYRYGGRVYDRTATLLAVLDELPTLRDLIWVGTPPHKYRTAARVSAWADLIAGDDELVIDEVGFEHPLWVLFSSGTTGVPKGIVHGHGGILLEHRKVLGLHADLRDDGVLMVVGSTSWVVWTMQVSGLLTGATIVLLEGSPAAPELGRIWRVSAEQQVSVLGIGAAYVHACLRAGLSPGTEHDLSALRMLQVTGSPLSDDGSAWVYDAVGPVWLASMSGGTDVASIFVGGVVSSPVVAGRIQGPALGVAVAVWDSDGRPVLDEPGELVITAPMPSMPLRFWGDTDGERYRSSYFDTWPGTWRHGDVAEVSADGSWVIHGRSDSTLNRNGVRMGSADIYGAVERLAIVQEALVVGVEEGADYYMPLYVSLADGVDAHRAVAEIRAAICSSLSPRYLPDEIVVVRGVPHTRTGKKLEVPIKRLLQGEPLDRVVDLGAVDDADLLREYADLAGLRRDRRVAAALPRS